MDEAVNAKEWLENVRGALRAALPNYDGLAIQSLAAFDQARAVYRHEFNEAQLGAFTYWGVHQALSQLPLDADTAAVMALVLSIDSLA